MPDIQTTIAKFDKDLRNRESTLVKDILRKYRSAYQDAINDLDKVMKKTIEARRDGEKINKEWLIRETQLRAVIKKLQGEMNELSTFLKDRIDQETEKSLTDGVINSNELILSQMPPPEFNTTNKTFFSGFNSEAVIAQAARTYQDTPSLARIRNILGAAAPLVEDALISGMVRGISPRDLAREISQKTGLVGYEALRLARTEMINSYRHANLENYRVNNDVVKGWQWMATLDQKMCAMCLAMHGTEHGHDESFDTHPNCRCVPIPITATWEELGIPGLEERRTKLEDGSKWLTTQPVHVQERILTKQGRALYLQGKVKLDDFVDNYIDKNYGKARQKSSVTKALAYAEGRTGPNFSVMRVMRETDEALVNAKVPHLYKTGKYNLNLLGEDGIDDISIPEFNEVNKIIDKAFPGKSIDDIVQAMAFPDGSKVEMYLSDGKVVFEGTWHGKSGEYISMIRSVNAGKTKNTGWIRHEVIVVDGFKPGSGMGTKIFNEAIERYEKAGIKKVTALADGELEDVLYNGYYTWARLGYDGQMSAKAARTLKGAGWNVSEGDSIQQFVLDNGSKGLKAWKEYGSSFEGIFDVTAGSKSRIILDSYVRHRFHPDIYLSPSLSPVGQLKAKQLQSKISRFKTLEQKGIITDAQTKQLESARAALRLLNRESPDLIPRADLQDLVKFRTSKASPFYRVKSSGMNADDLEVLKEAEDLIAQTAGTINIEVPIRKYTSDDFRTLYKGTSYEKYAEDLGGAYDPYKHSIAIANNSPRELNVSVVAHEWAHAMDWHLGKTEKITNTGVFDRMLNRAIDTNSMERILKEYQKGDDYAQYLLRKDEVFARLMEQYAMSKSSHYRKWLLRDDASSYWTKEEFEELIPHIEKNLKEVGLR